MESVIEVGARVAGVSARTLTDAERAWLTVPEESLDAYCAWVAEGGAATEYCKSHGLRFGVVQNWIQGDKGRAARWVAALNDRTEWEQETVLAEVRALALADVSRAFNEDDSLKPVKEWPKGLRKALASYVVETDKDGVSTVKAKFASKEKMLELMMRRHGLLVDRVDVRGSFSMEQIVGASMEAVADAPGVVVDAPSEAVPVKEAE